jgi:hypothetical protein
MAHHTEMPTGHRSTITSSPLLLFLKLLHQTHHHITLSIAMDSLPHICTSVMMPDTETPTGHRSTITSSLLLPYPLTHHARLLIINTDGTVTAYMHQYRDTRPAPSQDQALGHDTETVPRHPGQHSPWLLKAGPPNIGHSVALEAWYPDGYAHRYYWTRYPGKLDGVLYRMKFAWLGLGIWSKEE